MHSVQFDPALFPALLSVLVVLTAGGGCGRAPVSPTAPTVAPPGPPKVVGPPLEVVAAKLINRPQSGFERIHVHPEALLDYQAVPSGLVDGYEVRAKVRVHFGTDLFKEVNQDQEFARRGLLPPEMAKSDPFRVGRSELEYDPFEEAPTNQRFILLSQVHREGETMEGYGTMNARLFVDRWEFSGFGFTINEDFGQPRAEFPATALISGSPEAEQIFAAAQAARKTRLAKLGELEAKARALVTPGRRFTGTYDYNFGDPHPGEITFEAPEVGSSPTVPGTTTKPGQIPVSATITTVWPHDTQRTPTSRRLTGLLLWRDPGYKGALEFRPRLELRYPEEGETERPRYATGFIENGQLTLEGYLGRLRARESTEAPVPVPRPLRSQDAGTR